MIFNFADPFLLVRSKRAMAVFLFLFLAALIALILLAIKISSSTSKRSTENYDRFILAINCNDYDAITSVANIDSGWLTKGLFLSRDAKMVSLLLDAGGDVNYKDEFGCTPLHFAAARCDKAVIDVLAQSGGDVNSRDNRGMTPLHWVVFPAAGLDTQFVPTLDYTSESAQCTSISTLLGYGASVDSQDENGYTPLIRAARGIYADPVTLLLQRGASISLHTRENLSVFDVAVNRKTKEALSAVGEEEGSGILR